MDALADGRYKTELPRQSHLELEEMAAVFRKMAQAIQSRETALQVTAEESRKNEKKFRVIFESANDGILVADLDAGKILTANHRFAQMMDMDRDEMIGLEIGAVFPSASDLEHLKQYGQKASQEAALLFEQTISKKDGSLIYTEVNATRLEVDGADQFIGFFRDISPRVKAQKEKKALESQLRQAHKMEAIGTLAGGIAHDFNNLLGIILGNLELAMEDLPKWTPVRQYLDEVKTAGFRARDVVRQLLSFTRKSEQEKIPTHLSLVIKESVRLLRASIPSSVELKPGLGRPAPG